MPLYRRPGSAHWWVRISIASRKTRRSTGTNDLEEAQEFEQHERTRLWRLYKLGDRGSVLWKEVTARYLEDSKRERLRDRQIIAALAEDLDNEPVANLDADAIHELRQNLLAEGKAHSTVDRFMRTIRAILRKCVAWRVLESCPPIPMYNPPAPEPRWLTPQQFARLLTELPDHLALAATFAVQTGLRHDSMLELTWDRVDLKTRRLWVPGSQMKAGRAHGIPINSKAVATLMKLRRSSPTGDSVFQWKGERLRNCNTNAFRQAVSRAGLTPLRWHDLRHTFAAWAVQSGVTLQELMELGGWASYSMVLRYAHLSADHLASAADKIGAWRGTAAKRPRKAR